MDVLKKLIFIVEDNEIYSKTMREFINLSFPGKFSIKLFNIGELCLMEIEKSPFLIIMDYFLDSKYNSATNGIEIIKRIHVIKPSTNIIVLSSQKDFKIILEAIKQFNCLYIQKDLTSFDKVESRIKDLLNTPPHKPFEALN